MRTAKYLETPAHGDHAGAHRRVIELPTREHERHLATGHTSVTLECDAAEYAALEVGARVRNHHLLIARLEAGLAEANGERHAPTDEADRVVWVRQLGRRRQMARHDEGLLAHNARRLEMLRAVLAGKQGDDRLPPLPETIPPRADPDPLPSEEDTGVEVSEGESPTDGEAVAEVVRHLTRLGIPADLGRPRVREMLRERAPDWKVGDALLSAAIRYRKPVPTTA